MLVTNAWLETRKMIETMNKTLFARMAPLAAGALLTLPLTGCVNINIGGYGRSMGIMGLLHLVLVVYAIIQIVSSGLSSTSKLIWVLVVLFIPWIGPIAWFVFGRGSN